MRHLALFLALTACDSGPDAELPAAFYDFSAHIRVYTDGDEVVIESDGLPDHTSPYWSPSNPLHIEADGNAGQLAPGYIDDFNGSYTLRVPVSPVQANRSSSTGLGPIGIAVSGAMIYNNEEGPNVPLDNAVVSFDYTGAHTGPQSYHYHLEPTAWSTDDDALIGIISDGFLLYGRKCASSDDHPTDLDGSGGHTSTTQHRDEAHYHYHIANEAYLGEYYVLFAGDYQGSPIAIQ